jgi:hypothetical protein
LRPGWTPFWRAGSALLLLCIPPRVVGQQQPDYPRSIKANANVAPPQRNDELTLARLRPGQDDVAKAQRLFRKPSVTKFDGTNHIWQDACRHQTLSIIADANSGMIQEVRVSENNSKFDALAGAATAPSSQGCAAQVESKYRWTTGHGLLVGSACSRVVAIYGQPGNRGPSTKDGQQLELLYYAFDWAGPEVPQVMAVLCTPERNAKPGRVVEITLMAPSL